MSEKNSARFPYIPLGNYLKKQREKRQESLAEVSGAVEIEVAQLTEIEQGKIRPTEDILLLLISHFAMKDDEATKLWELAGFDQDDTQATHMVNDEAGETRSSVMVMPGDARIVYTDMVHVMVNNYGVVMNFMQGAGPSNQPLAVARIGMSKEHARSVLEVLKTTLEQAEKPNEPKSLPQQSTQPDTKATS